MTMSNILLSVIYEIWVKTLHFLNVVYLLDWELVYYRNWVDLKYINNFTQPMKFNLSLIEKIIHVQNVNEQLCHYFNYRK